MPIRATEIFGAARLRPGVVRPVCSFKVVGAGVIGRPLSV
jgi:hypothetical protein